MATLPMIFSDPNRPYLTFGFHIYGTAEARVLKFCTEVGHIKR